MLNLLLENQTVLNLVKQLEDTFSKAPHLPKGLNEFFVKIAPYMALLGGVLSLLAGPILGLLSVLTLNPMIVLMTVVAAVLSLVNAALLLSAFSPLKNREMRGWLLLFWSDLLGAVQVLFSIFLRQASITSLISLLIGFYILFEMKSFYSKK